MFEFCFQQTFSVSVGVEPTCQLLAVLPFLSAPKWYSSFHTLYFCATCKATQWCMCNFTPMRQLPPESMVNFPDQRIHACGGDAYRAWTCKFYREGVVTLPIRPMRHVIVHESSQSFRSSMNFSVTTKFFPHYYFPLLRIP